jgi:hypothetical protein
MFLAYVGDDHLFFSMDKSIVVLEKDRGLRLFNNSLHERY